MRSSPPSTGVETFPPSRHSPDTFGFWCLCGLNGLLFFRIYLLLQPFPSPGKDGDFNGYLLGLLVFFPLGLIYGGAVETLRHRWLPSYSLFYPLLVLLHLFALLTFLHPVLCEERAGNLLAFLAVPSFLVAVLVLVASRTPPVRRRLWEEGLYGCLPVVTAVWFLTLPGIGEGFPGAWSPWNYALFAGLVLLLGLAYSPRAVSPVADGKLKRLGTAVLIFIAVMFLLLEPRLPQNSVNYDFYLGPLCDLKAGKALLVNIHPQYGIGVFYFLGGLFHVLPLGYGSLYFILFGLYILQAYLLFFVLRQLFEGYLPAIMTLLLCFLICYGGAGGDDLFYPSVGPLRFGFGIFLVFLVTLRNGNAARKNLILWMESLAVALAGFWSLEVMAYTVPAYGVFMLFETLSTRHENWRYRWGEVARRTACIAGLWMALMGLFYVDVLRRSHQWPHWAYYFDYLRLYKGGFGMLFVPERGAWWLVTAILLVSLLACLGLAYRPALGSRPLRHLNSLFLLTMLGLGQFVYYLGRAHINNLIHVAMPSIVLGLFWLSHLYRWRTPAIPAWFRIGTLGAGVLALAFYLQPVLSESGSKVLDIISAGPGGLSDRWGVLWKPAPRSSFLETAERMMDRYSGARGSDIFFFGDRDVEVSLATGRVEPYPYNGVEQCEISPLAKAAALACEPELQAGDCVYLSPEMDLVKFDWIEPEITRNYRSTLERDLFSRLRSRYRFKWVEQENGISVYQVTGALSTR